MLHFALLHRPTPRLLCWGWLYCALGGALPALAQQLPASTALPTGARVVAGQASVAQSGAQLQVHQGSERAAIDWQSFDIGSQAQVQFVQPSATSVALNRVLGQQASQIFGRLSANGQVFLSNANGIYFAPSANVNVGALVASTHQIALDDFMAGRYHFTRASNPAQVFNDGLLQAQLQGYIALLAPEVRNQGVILAPAGTVALAAGEAITLQLDAGRLTGLQITPAQLQTLVENRQAVLAPGGLIVLSARSAEALRAGVVRNSGTLEASSLTARGGVIRLEGDQIHLDDGALLDARGAHGGGSVQVGGAWQGSGELHQAQQVLLAAGAGIDASATGNGDGGQVVLWSDVRDAVSRTAVHGRISARGGPQGGNGGAIETSGHALNVDGARVDAGAVQSYRGGRWLLDPADASITQPVANSYQATLNTGTNVDNYVEGNITWQPGVSLSKTAGGDATLTLRSGSAVTSDRVITLNGAQIASTSGALNLVLRAWATSGTAPVTDGGHIVVRNSSISTNGGHVWIGGGPTDITWNGLTVGNTFAPTWAQNTQGVLIDNSSIRSGAGDIRINGRSNASGGAAGNSNYGVWLQENTLLQSTSGDITVMGSATGRYANGGGIVLQPSGGSGTIRIQSDSGDIRLLGNSESNASTPANATRVGVGLYASAASGVTVQSGSGDIIVQGQDLSANSSSLAAGVLLDGQNLRMTSTSGDITLNGRSAANPGPTQQGLRLDADAVTGALLLGDDGCQCYSGTLRLQADAIVQASAGGSNGAIRLRTQGALTIEPVGASFTWLGLGNGGTNSLTFDNHWDFGPTLGSFTLGKPGNSSNLTLASSVQASGPIALYGADLALQGTLRSADLIRLQGTGVVGGSGALQANELQLLGGDVTLTQANNQVAHLSASGVGSLRYRNQGALTLDAVSASGPVDIATHSGNLSLTGSITSSDSSAQALQLNAGQDSAAGTSSGGDLLVPAGSSVSVGSGGTARLLSGSVAGSSGLTALVGNSSGHFRYGSDEASAAYSIPLAPGLSAIYREQPQVQIAVNDSSASYGSAIGGFSGVSGLLNGDSAQYQAQALQYAGSGQIRAGSYQVAVSNEATLAGLGYALNGQGSQGSLIITPKILGLAGSAVADKTYDGNASAQLTGAGTLSGTLAGDQVSADASHSSAQFTDKNAGAHKSVSITGIALSGADASNYHLTSSSTSTTASITPAALTLAASSDSKVYDASTRSSAAVTTSGLLGSDSVSNLQQSFASKNVLGANGSTLLVNGGYQVNDGNGGANYSVSTHSALGTITPAALTLAASTDSKVYDASTRSSAAVTTSGLLGSDSVSNLQQSFASKNVLGANGSTLVVGSGYQVNDGNGGANYSVSTQTASGTITPAALTLAASTDSKVYDASTRSSAAVTTSGLLGSDSVSNLQQSFASKNVLGANGSTLVVGSGYQVNDGNGGANYSVSTHSALGTITPAALTLAASTDSKVYDASTRSSAAVTTSGLLGSDSVSNLRQSFASKNVLGANGSTLVVGSGYQVNDGNGGANYSVSTQTASGTITARSLHVDFRADDKVYDGNIQAQVHASDNRLPGDQMAVESGSAVFADPNAGQNKPVWISGIYLRGADAGNYSLQASTARTSANITLPAAMPDLGGALGQWFDPVNWARCSIPDLPKLTPATDSTNAQEPSDWQAQFLQLPLQRSVLGAGCYAASLCWAPAQR